MNKKPDTASALAGILKAKRGDERPDEPVATVAAEPEPTAPPLPSPAPLPPAPAIVAAAASRGRYGKSSDKANYSQYSLYLRKDTRKKVGRALDDADAGQDFSELVQELLEQWLKSRT